MGDVRSGCVAVLIIARSAYYVPLPPGASKRPDGRPSVSIRLHPHKSAKNTKSKPPETDLANSIAGKGVPFLIHFGDLTQKRQLTQSDSIIPILYVDDKKNPEMDCSKLRAPCPAGVV